MVFELAIVFIILLVGSFIQGTSGFGMGLFAMGLLPIMMPIKESSLLVISLTTIVSLTIVLKIYKYIKIKGLLIILAAALTGRIFSFLFLHAFGDMDFLKKWLGFLLVAMVAYLFIDKKKDGSDKHLTPIFPIILGFIGGFIGGVFAIGGPFFVFYFMLLYKEKHSYNANLQMTFLFVNLFTLILHMLNGDLNSSFYAKFMIGVLSVFIGTNVGMYLFEKLPRERVQKSAMFVILLAGINLILFT
jgi:uncharacterized membrane protein YfcA